MVIQFPLFVSSKPHCQAELRYNGRDEVEVHGLQKKNEANIQPS